MNCEAISFSPRRIAAMVLRYWYLLRSSWARLTELVYWPAVQMLMWGFLQTYLSQQTSTFARAGGVLVGAVLCYGTFCFADSSAFRSRFWRRCTRATSAT